MLHHAPYLISWVILFYFYVMLGSHFDFVQFSWFLDRSEECPKDYYSNTTRRVSLSSSSSTTSVHVTALDGIVNVNSLFTIAVFVGLSLTTPGQHSLENPSACDAGVDVAKKLLVFEVVSSVSFCCCL